MGAIAFTAALADRARGAVELHYGPATMTGNVSDKYETLVHVTSRYAGAVDSNEIAVTGNTAIDAATGIRLWSATGRTLRGVTVSGNTVSVANAARAAYRPTDPFSGISLNLDTGGTWDGDLEGIDITGNTVTLEAEERTGFSEYSSGGIMVHGNGSIRGVRVTGNTIRNSPVQGVRVHSYAGTASGIAVTDNTIIDAGNSSVSAAGYRACVALGGVVKDSVVERNHFVDTGVGSPNGRKSSPRPVLRQPRVPRASAHSEVEPSCLTRSSQLPTARSSFA